MVNAMLLAQNSSNPQLPTALMTKNAKPLSILAPLNLQKNIKRLMKAALLNAQTISSKTKPNTNARLLHAPMANSLPLMVDAWLHAQISMKMMQMLQANAS